MLSFFYFNSIKVQLKRAGLLDWLDQEQFQFHKGTIKTNNLGFPAVERAYFNSIKVQLKLVYPLRFQALCPYFNSIKVQLKLLHDVRNVTTAEISIP